MSIGRVYTVPTVAPTTAAVKLLVLPDALTMAWYVISIVEAIGHLIRIKAAVTVVHWCQLPEGCVFFGTRPTFANLSMVDELPTNVCTTSEKEFISVSTRLGVMLHVTCDPIDGIGLQIAIFFNLIAKKGDNNKVVVTPIRRLPIKSAIDRSLLIAAVLKYRLVYSYFGLIVKSGGWV